MSLSLTREKIDTTRLVIATPVLGGPLPYQYTSSLWKTARELDRVGLEHDLIFSRGPIVEEARNRAVQMFLEEKSSTHLLFVDGDQVWDPAAVLKLIATGHSFVGCAVPLKRKTLGFNLRVRNPTRIESNAIEVNGIGTGFLLLERCVFERIRESHPQWKIAAKSRENQDREDGEVDPSFAYFSTSIHDGKYFGEDYTFCNHWKDIGGHIWCEPTSEIGHVGTKIFRANLMESFASMGFDLPSAVKK